MKDIMATGLSRSYFWFLQLFHDEKRQRVSVWVSALGCWCLIINFFNGRALTPNIFENRYKRFSLAEHSTCNGK